MTPQETSQALKVNADRSGVLLSLRVQPGAKQNVVVGMYGNDTVKLAVSAPPVDGKANAALKKMLSNWFRVPQAQVLLKSGESSRSTVFIISGVSLEDAAEILSQKSK